MPPNPGISQLRWQFLLSGTQCFWVPMGSRRISCQGRRQMDARIYGKQEQSGPRLRHEMNRIDDERTNPIASAADCLQDGAEVAASVRCYCAHDILQQDQR